MGFHPISSNRFLVAIHVSSNKYNLSHEVASFVFKEQFWWTGTVIIDHPESSLINPLVDAEKPDPKLKPNFGSIIYAGH